MNPDDTIPDAPDNQGEGNRDAARNYNAATRRFIDEGKVEPAARSAAQASPDEAAEMRSAEKEGRSHAKGEDPALHRKQSPADVERADEHGRADDRGAVERGSDSGGSSDAAQRSVQRESMSDSGTDRGAAQERQR